MSDASNKILPASNTKRWTWMGIGLGGWAIIALGLAILGYFCWYYAIGGGNAQTPPPKPPITKLLPKSACGTPQYPSSPEYPCCYTQKGEHWSDKCQQGS